MVSLLCSATALAEPSPGNSIPIPEKNSTPTGEPTYEGRVEGDTVDDPFIINSLPFTGSGDTCPFANDYDASCPYTGSTSPDVVYRYYCSGGGPVVIDLCDSQYDTKVYVYEDEYVNGGEIACNDDSPGCGPSGYRSWLLVDFQAGHTYYVVVDGYGGDCGVYELFIDYYFLPCAECPPDGVMEIEPECIEPGNDIHNGGCNSTPPVFQLIDPSEDPISVCGTSGTYTEGSNQTRDTDWYQLDLTQTSEISLYCMPDFNMTIGFIDGREGCENVSSFYSYATVPTCWAAELTETLPPGTWWVWIGPSGYSGVQCGAGYVCEITGYTPVTPVEDASWSTIKALFR